MDTYEQNDEVLLPEAQEEAVYEAPVVEESPAVEAPVVQEAAPRKKKSGKKFWKVFLCAFLVFDLVLVSVVGAAYVLTRRFDGQLAAYQAQMDALEQRLQKQENKGGQLTLAPSTSDNSGENAGYTPAQVYANNASAVVLIKSEIEGTRYSSGGTSTGSGFIVTANGYVVTNYHVVEGGSRLSVVTADNTEREAKLIGYDNANDVALLKVEAEDLPYVVLGDSDRLTVGDQVVAIGNPLGELTSTLTVGYVSAKERDVNTSGFAINMLQTDAAINSGNSGGPLFNMEGHVIGITTAKYSGSSSSGATIEGIGFAIPINDVRGLLEDLMNYGYSRSPYLGVSVSDMDAQAAAYYGMPVGAYVNEVVEGFCAHKAGLQAKDIITDVGGHAVGNVNDLSRALRNFTAGDTVEITVFRAGGELKLSVTLDEKPVETQPDDIPEQTGSSDGWLEGLFPGLG